MGPTDFISTADRLVRTNRVACVDLPALPLQLLLHRRPEWRRLPAAVVAEDNPQAPLLWVNEAARQHGVLPGQRYVAALSVCRDLRAEPVTGQRIARAVAALHRRLLQHGPRVEPAAHEPGVFWLDAGGLERVAGTPGVWAGRLYQDLRRAGFVAGVAVGFTRFGTFCLARTRRRVTVVPAPASETAACRKVPLARLELEPRVRDDLLRLGLDTVGDLMDLPAAGLGARFGPGVIELVELARGLRFDPVRPVLPPAPIRAREVCEEPETDAWRLLFLVKRLLHPLLDRLADAQRAAAQLHLDLTLADGNSAGRRESLRPAAPTLDAVLLLELIRLRLEQVDLAAGVECLVLELEPVRASPEVLELFRRCSRRDPEAALRAVARVRAELGDAAVVRAEQQEAHLPESAWRWVPVTELAAPAPRQRRGPHPLVRRLLARPRPLMEGPPELARDRGEQLLRAAAGPGGATVTRDEVHSYGPHLLSSHWWARESRRMYHFVEADGGRVLWVFHEDGRWYLQGEVE